MFKNLPLTDFVQLQIFSLKTCKVCLQDEIKRMKTSKANLITYQVTCLL